MTNATPVRVVDPLTKTMYNALLERSEKGFQLNRSYSNSGKDPELYLSPGWIDLHAHVYDGFTSISVPADDIGYPTGVHLIVDAGSAGEATLNGFRKYLAPQFKTEIKAWLNISSIGLVHMREVADLKLIDVERTVKAALDNRPFICGIKVRSSGAIVGEMGLQPLQLAVLAAREAGLPLMVHIGEAPPLIDEVLNELGAGDVVTHCFHGKIGHPWTVEGRPKLALQRALERGVKLDVGHGAASFSYDICRRAISNGLPDFSISTDAHIRNVKGPVYDLPTTMTKLLSCGMRLVDVIAGVTDVPAKVLGINNWCQLEGPISKATLFRLSDKKSVDRVYRDSKGLHVEPNEIIVPTSVIAGNEIIHSASYFMEEFK
jgi:dihydroorotase